MRLIDRRPPAARSWVRDLSEKYTRTRTHADEGLSELAHAHTHVRIRTHADEEFGELAHSHTSSQRGHITEFSPLEKPEMT